MLSKEVQPLVIPHEKRLIIAADAKDFIVADRYARAVGSSIAAIGLKKEIGHDQPLTAMEVKLLRRQAGLFVDSQHDLVPFAMFDAILADLRHYKPRFLTLHGNAGEEAMAKAHEAHTHFYKGREKEEIEKLKQYGITPTKLLVIPVMPDYYKEYCRRVHRCEPEEWAADVARWAVNSGMNGMFCGPSVVAAVNETLTPREREDFTIVVTGIRRACHIGLNGEDLIGKKQDICTAGQAIEIGADFVHVGLTFTSLLQSQWTDGYKEIYDDMQVADARLIAADVGRR